jgi:hypothetical protein
MASTTVKRYDAHAGKAGMGSPVGIASDASEAGTLTTGAKAESAAVTC